MRPGRTRIAAYGAARIRGPNIASFPVPPAPGDEIEARVILKTGDNITTDDIIPAGSAILPLRSNIPALSEHVFEQLFPGFAERAKNAGQGIIVGGENYGQGSSREHAAMAPMYLGIRAVIAKSFARIHRSNLINFGILPLEFDNPEEYERLEHGDVIILRDLEKSLTDNIPVTAENTTKNRIFTLSHRCSGKTAAILREGGLLRYVSR